MFPRPSAPPWPRNKKTRYLSRTERWARLVRVAARWRFRRASAGLLLNLCKANARLHWHPTKWQRVYTRWRAASSRIASRHQRKSSLWARAVGALLEQERVIENLAAGVFRVAQLLCLLVSRWPWSHTATAVVVWAATSRATPPGDRRSPTVLAGLLDYVPTLVKNYTVAVVP